MIPKSHRPGDLKIVFNPHAMLISNGFAFIPMDFTIFACHVPRFAYDFIVPFVYDSRTLNSHLAAVKSQRNVVQRAYAV